jgi:hypothetical protein
VQGKKWWPTHVRVYVDDLIITRTTLDEIMRFKEMILQFKMDDLRLLTFYLGLPMEEQLKLRPYTAHSSLASSIWYTLFTMGYLNHFMQRATTSLTRSTTIASTSEARAELNCSAIVTATTPTTSATTSDVLESASSPPVHFGVLTDNI